MGLQRVGTGIYNTIVTNNSSGSVPHMTLSIKYNKRTVVEFSIYLNNIVSLPTGIYNLMVLNPYESPQGLVMLSITRESVRLWFYAYSSTTMGLKYPLKKFDSQWPFPMGIWNDFITIFGKDCHIWNNSPRSLLSNVT